MGNEGSEHLILLLIYACEGYFDCCYAVHCITCVV